MVGVLELLEPSWDPARERTSLLVRVKSVDFYYDVVATSLIRGQTVRVQFADHVAFPSELPVCLLNFSIARDEDGIVLFEEQDSRWYRHAEIGSGDLLRVKELCCGIGALGVGASRVGFSVVAYNDVRAATLQALGTATDAPRVCGCISRDDVVAGLWDACPGACSATSGFSCQPFSLLGNRRGEDDDRSLSLPASLRAAWMLQVKILVLECVEPAATHPFVRRQLEEFKQATGFRSAEVILDLAHKWVSSRKRWWCVLFAPDLPAPHLQPWIPDRLWPQVDAVLNSFEISPAQLQALRLPQQELEEFASRKPLRSYVLKITSRAPTALHSWGNPTQACPCGCRLQGFSQARLDAGICAVLIPLPDCQYRHLSAAEAALLNGLMPSRSTGPSERLGLALVGQLASPLQSAWVLGSVACQLQQKHLIPGRFVDPASLIDAMRQELFQDAVALGMYRYPASEPGDTDIDESPASAEPPGPEPALPGKQVQVICPTFCPVAALLDRLYVETGVAATQAACRGCLLGRFDWLRPGEEVTLQSIMSGHAQAPALLAPCDTPAALDRLITPSMPATLRNELLALQQGWCSDDQLAGALQVLSTLRDQVYVIDPVSAAMALQFRDQRWLQPPLVQAADWSLITAVPVAGHWVTVHWRCVAGLVVAWSSDPREWALAELDYLHHLVSRALGKGLGAFRFQFGVQRPQVPGECGALALADLRSHLLGEPFAGNVDVPGVRASLLPMSFRGPALLRPPLFLASALPMLEQGLAGILKAKGVPPEVSHSRAQSGIQRLSASAVQSAMLSHNPWRELKQLASNSTPPYQWVLPSELQVQVQKRAEEGPAIAPVKKVKRKVPIKDVVPSSRQTPVLAPTPQQLRVPCGVFECEGHPLSQVQLAQVGPQSTGVVLVDPAAAAPYMHLHRPVSSGPLALLVIGQLCAEAPGAQGVQVRFQAECYATKDPVLLSAWMFQIGEGQVVKRSPASTTILEVAPSSVIRATVFRDTYPLSWDSFCKSPVKQLIEQCEQLQVCKALGCCCAKWHPDGTNDLDPVLEVWGRAFLSLQFKARPWAEAELFSCFIRVPAALLEPVLSASGYSGVFFEPRASDTKKPSDAFSVVWVPKASQQDALLIKQSHRSILGLARVGSRFGVRCRSTDAEELHAQVRPGVPFLSAQDVRSYQVGPFPFGTQRSAIAKAFAQFGWCAKPLQPVVGGTAQGLWWNVRANGCPPQPVLHTQHGEVLISELRVSVAEPIRESAVLAPKSTLRTLAGESQPAIASAAPDPLQTADPWQQYLNGRSQAPQAAAPPKVLSPPAVDVQALASQIEDRVMQKVGSHLSDTTGELGRKVATLEGQVSQIHGRMDSQEQMLRNMFQEQMSNIEALLTPKRRAVERDSS